MEEIKIGQRVRTHVGNVYRRISENSMVCEEASDDRTVVGRRYLTFRQLEKGWEILPDKPKNFNTLYEKLNEI